MKHPAVVHYKKVDPLPLHSTLLFWTAKCQKRNNKIFKSLSSCQKISAEILIHCGFFWKSIKKTLGILKLRIIAKVFYANKCVKCHTSIWWKFISKSKSGYEEWKYGKFFRQIVKSKWFQVLAKRTSTSSFVILRQNLFLVWLPWVPVFPWGCRVFSHLHTNHGLFR